MRLTFGRWVAMVGALFAIGMLKVAQETAIWQQAYTVGSQQTAIRALEQDTQWLQRDVLALASPVELSQAMERQQLKLVAWSTVTPATHTQSMMLAERSPELGE